MSEPLVSVKILVCVGPKSIYNVGKLYGETITVQSIIDGVLKKAAEAERRSLIFESVEAGQTEAALEKKCTDLDAEDLHVMSAAHLAHG